VAVSDVDRNTTTSQASFQSLPPPRRLCFRRWLSVCLLATLHKNIRTDLHEIFGEGWQWANEEMIKFWWRFGSPSGYRDYFPDSSFLGDTESGMNPRYRSRQADSGTVPAKPRWLASRRRHTIMSFTTRSLGNNSVRNL